jgi:CheY-like chemotaxis protein/HPt (histidine-containing phosphotransfer) domain-containing protein
MPYGSILIVDDIETNLYVAKGLTEPYKLSIDTAISGAEAIDKIKQGKVYDIVFMDHMMPEMDGIEATKIIRNMNYTRPIVALTANALAGQKEMFLSNGFNDFLSKPMDLHRLDSILKKLIRDKQPPKAIEAPRTEKTPVAPTHEAEDHATDAHRKTGSYNGKRTAALILSNPRLLKIFIQDVEKAIQTLEGIFKSKFHRDADMQLFVITVHGMKSVLASAGNTELSAFALKLEKAGKIKDTAEMLSETPLFIDGLRKLVKEITPKN